MPTDPGQLAEAIDQTLRLAQARLAELQAAPGTKRPLLDRPAVTEDIPLHGSDGVMPKDFAGLLQHDLPKAFSILQNMVGDDTLVFTMSMSHAAAQIILERVADHESLNVIKALEVLEIARKAGQLWQLGAWQELNAVSIDLTAASSMLMDTLVEMVAGPKVPLATLQQTIDESRPSMQAHLRALKAQQRASQASARKRLPRRQQRIQAFVAAIRADPQGGPARWTAAVAPVAFGGAEARHVRGAERWFHRYREQIQAALAADTDSPADCQSVPPDS